MMQFGESRLEHEEKSDGTSDNDVTIANVTVGFFCQAPI